jgi:hypothetical protein
MGTFFRVLAALLLVIVLAGIGTAIYNQGVSAGLAEAAQQADGAEEVVTTNPAYMDGPFKAGFGVIGFLIGTMFFVLLLVITLGLARAAFGMWGGGGRGPGGHGWSSRRDRIEEWHREMHRRDGPDGEQRPAGA